jgi:hypothetical protein
MKGCDTNDNLKGCYCSRNWNVISKFNSSSIYEYVDKYTQGVGVKSIYSAKSNQLNMLLKLTF